MHQLQYLLFDLFLFFIFNLMILFSTQALDILRQMSSLRPYLDINELQTTYGRIYMSSANRDTIMVELVRTVSASTADERCRAPHYYHCHVPFI